MTLTPSPNRATLPRINPWGWSMLGKVYQKPSGRYRLKSLAMFSIVRSEIIPEIIKESYNFRVANGLHIEAVAKARVLRRIKEKST
jgi:hypothetical protein